jgi:hypothetical protein
LTREGDVAIVLPMYMPRALRHNRQILGWIIYIDDEYWIKFKTRPLGRWTKNIYLASIVSTKEKNVYIREWKKFGVKAGALYRYVNA